MLRIYPCALAASFILFASACSNPSTAPAPPPPEPQEVVVSMEVEGAYEGSDEGAHDAAPAPTEMPVPVPVVEPAPEEEVVMPSDPDAFTREDLETLTALGWDERVGDGLGVWVNVERQQLYLIAPGAPIWTVPCATATNGTGSISGSEMTPLGWHRVSEKFGDGAVWGQVFRSRGATHEVWTPGGDVEEDLVLTRILWLEGLEAGKNQGKNAEGLTVDSKKRYIYIHGTNGESVIGTPSSHGCVRMLNDDVIALFDRVPVGTPVLITEHGAT